MSTRGADTKSRRTSRIAVRVSPAEREAIESAADEAGLSVSAHLRQSAIDGGGRRVPELNEDAWVELAPMANNLNQLSRAANTMRVAISESGFQIEGLRQAVDLMGEVRDLCGGIARRVETLRLALLGSSLLITTADALDAWRRASRLDHIEVDGEELGELAGRLRALGELLEEERR